MHRMRAATADMPVGIDEDLCPRWAWRQPDGGGRGDGGGGGGGGASEAAAAAAASAAALDEAAAPSGIAADVAEALVRLANDEDVETATRLSPVFVARNRRVPLTTVRTAAAGPRGGEEGGGSSAAAADAPLAAAAAATSAPDEGDDGVLLTLSLDDEVGADR
jgi:hypothetical protein